MAIKFFEIDTNEMYSTYFLYSKNTIINWFVLFGNKSWDECTYFCPDFLRFFFQIADLFNFVFTYACMCFYPNGTHIVT